MTTKTNKTTSTKTSPAPKHTQGALVDMDETSSVPKEETGAPAQVKQDYQLLSIDLIDDPDQPMRTDLTPASCESLVLSIKQVGIIEPLIVKKVNKRYEVIAGHRRLYSAKLAKLVEVPCFVREATSEQTEMLKIHENLYREDVKPADEASHFEYLMNKHKMTPAKVANLINKSQTYVVDRLAILNYPPFLREALDASAISFSVAREFARFGDENQMRQAVYYAKRSGMTSDMARKWVKDWEYEQKHKHQINPTASDQREGVKPVEHSVECVYCKQPVKLIEASVVYMHPNCLIEANTPAPTQEVEQTREA